MSLFAVISYSYIFFWFYVQPVDIGLPSGNGKKLSCCQAQLGQATGLAVAYFLSISCDPFPVGHPMSVGCTSRYTYLRVPNYVTNVK